MKKHDVALLGVLAIAFAFVMTTPAKAAGPWTMTVTVVGSGTVTSVPSGISCPPDCTEQYADGTLVDLTANPDAGQTFTSWAGSVCTAQTPDPVCNDVPMTNTRSITATFSTGGGTTHFVGAGDIAVAGGKQAQTAAEIQTLNPPATFTLGDNVYPSGALAGFNSLYDPTWGAFKNKTSPTPGNHDYMTAGASGYFNYFGVPSYYRTTVGTWDVYALNSNITRTAGSPQVTWLSQQLAANPNPCIIAMWHHPRYSSGTNHGSDTSVQPFWDELTAAGATIVLNGHEHNYERFAPKSGIREFVVGTGGNSSSYPFGAPLSGSEKRLNKFGVLDLALSSGSYTFRFMSTSNAVLDSGSGTC